MKLDIYLGTSGDNFIIDLFNNDFVDKWVNELRWCLDNCQFDQTESFSSLMDLEQACDILTKSCQVINSYLPGMIDIRSDLLNQDQEYFNYLHGIFEKLNGRFGLPTRFFMTSPDVVKQAIRNLNFFVHRIEKKTLPKTGFYISFDKNCYRRQQFCPQDYQYFEYTIEPGTLFLHYAEVGKEFIDLFEDDLPITYDNFKNLHYYSGEAWLTFEQIDYENVPGFFPWISQQGFDPRDKKLGHGRIPLGKVRDIDKSSDLIYNNRYLQKILIEE